jgi:hypothetical protein
MWRETLGGLREFITGGSINKGLRVNDSDGSSADPELLKRVFLGRTVPAELEPAPLKR